jgi:hypothetical protein
MVIQIQHSNSGNGGPLFRVLRKHYKTGPRGADSLDSENVALHHENSTFHTLTLTSSSQRPINELCNHTCAKNGQIPEWLSLFNDESCKLRCCAFAL